MIERLGVLGAGHLAGFVCRGLRASGWKGKILISPYNKTTASSFSKQFDAQIAHTSQDVVNQSEVVLVSVRPKQYLKALCEIAWPAKTILLSVMAGVRIDALKKLVGDMDVVRAMPVSAAEIGQSPTPIYPDQPEVRMLLSLTGTVIPVKSEIEFEMATVNAAVYGWHFALIDELIKANIAAGLPEEQSREIVTKTLSAASAVAAQPQVDPGALIQSLATPGGITAEGLRVLEDRDALSTWTEAFNRVAERLRKSE